MNRTTIVSKLLLYVAVLIAFTLVAISSVEAVEDSFVVSDEDLPYNTTVNLTLRLPENNTAFLNRTDSESRLVIEYPSEVSFESNETTVRFNVTVSDYEVYFNQTLNATFNITNTANSNSIEYLIQANVTTKKQLLNDTSNFTVYLLNDEFVVNITSNLLPFSGELEYRLRGEPNGTVNVSCEGWLSCPSSVVFPSDSNTTRVLIDYTIPLNAPIGNTTYEVNLTSPNNTRTQKVTFIVKEPGVNLISYTWNDDCFKPIGDELYLDYDKCWQEYEEFQIERLSQIISRARSLSNKTIQEICPTPEPEYVIAGSYDDELRDEVRQLRDSNADLSRGLRTANGQVESLTYQLEECRDTELQNQTEVLASAFSEALQIRDNAEAYRSQQVSRGWSAFWTILLFIIVGLVIAGVILGRRRNKWKW